MILKDSLLNNKIPQRKKFKTEYHYDDIISLDFETSSLFKINGEWKQFDDKISKDEYHDIDKMGIVYAFGININGTEYVGRDLFELKMILKDISDETAKRYVYIQNLGFDFHFLLNIIDDFEVFARKSHAPMKAYSPSLNIEFRCSYMLTGYGLERYAELNNLDVRKAVGKLDYSKVRHSNTELTDNEIEYILIDIQIVYLIVKKHIEEYKHIFNIPLTKTGKVREKVKKLYTYYDKQKISKEIETNFTMFKVLCDTFVGGYTHANSLYVNEILKNVKSKDLVSSYPAVMIQEKFPRTKFTKKKVTHSEIYSDKLCMILKVGFWNINTSLNMTYLSESKAIKLINATTENGRVVSADYCEYYITNIDFQIIEYSYDIENKYEILESFVAFASYLPSKYRDFIIDLYDKKTNLKGIEDMEDVYLRSKEDINSLYGMTVTNTIRDDVTFNSVTGEWDIQNLNIDEVNKRLEKQANTNNYISFAWGIFITAYARKRLWDMIRIIDSDVVYCDTDSIKYIEDYEKEFENFNAEIRNKNKRISKIMGYDFNLIKDLGTFETEKTSDKFITFGAKKYASEIDNKLKVTISGLNKKKAVEMKGINSIEDIKTGTTWGYNDSGRTEVIYNSNQEKIILKDYQGNLLEVNQRFGVCIKPSTYTLAIGFDFNEYIELVKSLSSVKLSQLGFEEENKILTKM